MSDIVWLNTDYYTIPQIVLFLIGGACWAVSYVYMIKKIIKDKFVEMPGAVLASNIVWEFLWGFIFPPNMGMVVKLGYVAWFFLDLVIVWGFYKYGYKQVNSSLKNHYKSFFTFGILAFLAFTYVFVKQGIDNPIGANSAFAGNLLISSLYIIQFLRLEDKSGLSFTAAWTKGLGTALITVMCVMRWPENHWIVVMGSLCFIMDVYYTWIFFQQKRSLIK